ncbi:Asp23/Gls24 family envelope stress response protein [Peptoniphilus sp.]|uniref:Asp23/Gls24 family envelope stress response protein n=1 Tax=Peptoniphilus sp. TaxID=1971214 RepID=UPI003D912D73
MVENYLIDENISEGQIKISDDVIATIATVAAESVEGVVKVSTNFKSQMSDILNTKNINKGVRVNVGERQTVVDIYITVEYGVKVVELSEKVQQAAKEAIENMTDFDVVEINVHINGIAVKSED